MQEITFLKCANEKSSIPSRISISHALPHLSFKATVITTALLSERFSWRLKRDHRCSRPRVGRAMRFFVLIITFRECRHRVCECMQKKACGFIMLTGEGVDLRTIVYITYYIYTHTHTHTHTYVWIRTSIRKWTCIMSSTSIGK